jgi:hypothetical protein
MPIDSRAATAARRLRAGHPLRPLAGCLLALAVLRPAPAVAQTDAAPTPANDPWTLEARYLHLGPDGTARDATPSLAFTLAHRLDLGALGRAGDWRADAGWLRGVRGGVTAQGVTLGLSAGVRTPSPRLTIRPGLALLAGWAASQDSATLYDWRGLPGTPQDGTTGTQYALGTRRGRTIGAGIALDAELRVTRALALSASVRRWRFGGEAAAANRSMTLGGIGLVLHPGEIARGAKRLAASARRGTSVSASGASTASAAGGDRREAGR